jgi:hypothetical protein
MKITHVALMFGLPFFPEKLCIKFDKLHTRWATFWAILKSFLILFRMKDITRRGKNFFRQKKTKSSFQGQSSLPQVLSIFMQF